MVVETETAILLLIAGFISCNANSTTETESPITMPVYTTTPRVIYTDMPQADVDDALDLDVGRYTTVKFTYYNNQFKPFDDPFSKKWFHSQNRCFDDYIKCIISQDNPTPVCAFLFHDKNRQDYFTFNSYCDVYLDNCRRGYRHWRSFDYGKCISKTGEIVETG